MIMNYGSFAYFLFIGCALIGLAVLALVLKRFSLRVQKTVVLVIALLNLFQHLCKSLIYPHYWGNGFTCVNTAYNMCALVIMVMPFALISKRGSWKSFEYIAGIAGGFGALVLPVWFIGKNIIQWEFLRFYVCHVLLFYSSSLPFILKHHKVSWKYWYKYPLYFALYLVIIFLDLVFSVYLGLIDGATPETLHATLDSINTMSLMHPSSQMAWIVNIIDPITPDFLFSDGYYVPILWYLYPLCIVIALAGIAVGAIFDRKNMAADFKRYKVNINNFFIKVKNFFSRNKKKE